LVQELFNEAAWPGQALGRPLTGTPATIDAIQRADFLRHMRTHYVRGCTVIAAAGSIEHADLVKQVSKRLKAFRAGPRPKFEPAVPSTHSPVVHIHTRETEQTQIALGFRTCSRHDERRFALRLLNAMLGESMSSRLFQSIREDHGLVYSVYSATSFWEDVGDIVISAGLDGDKLQRTIDLVAKEIQLLREKPPGKAEFRRARDYAIGQMELSLEGTENRMMALGEHILGYGSVANPEGSKNRLSQVTPAEVRGVARDFLRMDRLTCALVTPRKRPGRVRDWVRAIG
jgi:predicted Zn-dependent peptidase